jgi:hypothetical protein
MTPDELRALADERGVAVQDWSETKRWAIDAEAAIRSTADALTRIAVWREGNGVNGGHDWTALDTILEGPSSAG